MTTIGDNVRTPEAMQYIVKNPYACDLIMQYLLDSIFYNDFVFIMRVLAAFQKYKGLDSDAKQSAEESGHSILEIEKKVNLNEDFLSVNSPLKLSLVAEDPDGIEQFIQKFQGKQTVNLIIGMYNLISHRFQRDVLPTFFQEKKVEYFKSLATFCRVSIKQYQRRVRKTEKLCSDYRSRARKTLKRSKIPVHLKKYSSIAGTQNDSINYHNLPVGGLSRSSTPSSIKSSANSTSFLSPTQSSKHRQVKTNRNRSNLKKNFHAERHPTFTMGAMKFSDIDDKKLREQQWNSSVK